MLLEWIRVQRAQQGEKLFSAFVAQLQQKGLLASPEASERFVRVCAELAVNHTLSNEVQIRLPSADGRPALAHLNFTTMDQLVRLLALLIRHHGYGVPFLSIALHAVNMVLLRDHDERGPAFNSRPYFRFYLGLLAELSPADDQVGAQFNTLCAFSLALTQLQPMRAPAFAFAWLELVSSRYFLPKLLMVPQGRGQPYFYRLLMGALRFLEPFLRNTELTEPIRLLYKGVLRILLVLLHDFPAFLFEHHHQLCDAVPPSCIQMRNLVLAALPRHHKKLPDPLSQQFKVDEIPGIFEAPRLSLDPEQAVPKPLLELVAGFLRTRQAQAVPEIRARLLLSSQESLQLGTRYSAPSINGLVLYLGHVATQGLAALPPATAAEQLSSGAPSELLQRLCAELDTEGRYLLLNAMANQLRYPNAHTFFHVTMMLVLYETSKADIVREQITRVVIERIIANRPHPWGLLIAFVELSRNQKFNFFGQPFARASPDVERTLAHLAGVVNSNPAAGGAPPMGGPVLAK